MTAIEWIPTDALLTAKTGFIVVTVSRSSCVEKPANHQGISRVAMIARDAGIVSCRLGTVTRATAPINPLVALIARVVGMASCRMIKVSSAILPPSYPQAMVGYVALLAHGHPSER